MATLFVYDGNATNEDFAAARQAFTQRHPKIRLLATNNPKRAREILDTQGALVSAVVTNVGAASGGTPGSVIQAYATRAGATSRRIVASNWPAIEAAKQLTKMGAKGIRPQFIVKGHGTVLDAVAQALPQLGL
ncbi:MAG: hypothetical protein KBA75_06200 [Alphaproteobacteria bacterium]|nr:hypothetical protein [Alphaproteobacteria bacterium]